MIKRIFTLTPKQPSVKNGRDTPEICKSSFDFGSTAGRNNPKIRVPSIHFRSTSPERCVVSRPNTLTEALFDNNGQKIRSVRTTGTPVWMLRRLIFGCMPGRAPKCSTPVWSSKMCISSTRITRCELKTLPSYCLMVYYMYFLMRLLICLFMYLLISIVIFIQYLYTPQPLRWAGPPTKYCSPGNLA